MIWRTLRCKEGRIRFWEIDGSGNVRCTLDPTHLPVTRLSKGTKNYQQVQLMRGTIVRWYYVHRLMAFSWIGKFPHPLRFIVDHRDGKSTNNRIENLRWVTITANNINRKCYGLFLEQGMYYPRIAGFIHRRFGTVDENLATNIRQILVECYVRYNTRFPDSGNAFPHYSIHTY